MAGQGISSDWWERFGHLLQLEVPFGVSRLATRWYTPGESLGHLLMCLIPMKSIDLDSVNEIDSVVDVGR